MAFQTLNLDLPTIAEIRNKNRAERRASAAIARRTMLTRSYKAAMMSSQTEDWSLSSTSANAEARRHLRPLRNRSRELQRNNGVLGHYIWMMGQNVAGAEGMTLSDVIEGDEENELDATLNEQVIKAFNDWSLPENASTSGKLSFADQQKLAIETVARDGEVLIRKRLDAPNKYGFGLQFLDVAWLDETFNAILANGHRVLMSVELNDLDRPVAYWLTRPSSDFLYPEYGQSFQRTRVSADEMLHLFIVTESECQARGIPHAHAVMEMMHTLHGYVDAEVYKNRAAACVTDYLIPPENSDGNEYWDDVKETQSVDGFAVGTQRDLEPAVQQILPPGYDVKTNDPNLPSGNFDPFVKGTGRFIASGLHVPYFRLFSDLNGVNYTSSRAGDNEAHDTYRYFQRWLKIGFCRPIFMAWAKEQMLRNVVPIRQVDYQRFSPAFDARGWDLMDPEKDSNAAVNDIDNLMDTRTRRMAERGLNFRKVVKKLAEEERIIADAELSKPEKTKSSTKPPQKQPQETDSEE